MVPPRRFGHFALRPAVLAMAVAACSGAPEPAGGGAASPGRARVVLGRLRIDDATPPEARPATVPPTALEGALRGALLAVGLVAEPAAAGDWVLTARATVAYGLRTATGLASAPAPGSAASRWAVQVSVRAPGDPVPLEVRCEAEDEAPFDGAPDALASALEGRLQAAAGRCAASLWSEIGVATQDEAGLIATLDAPEPARRRAAADRMGRLRARTAVAPLAAALKREADPETRLRFIGALAEIGDERAAPALIAVADPKDRELLRAVVDALSVLGGPTVEEFFDVLAMHDAAEVRELVQQAKARLAARRRP